MREQSHSSSANEYAQKNRNFTRYLIFRYMTAIFFFINLYWALLSLANWTLMGLVPVCLLFVDGVIIFEQTQKYWQPSNRLHRTKLGYWIQAGVNSAGIVFILLGWQDRFFPLLASAGRTLLLVSLTLGLICCVYIERKIWLIEKNRDSYLTYLRAFENKGGNTNEFRK